MRAGAIASQTSWKRSHRSGHLAKYAWFTRRTCLRCGAMVALTHQQWLPSRNQERLFETLKIHCHHSLWTQGNCKGKLAGSTAPTNSQINLMPKAHACRHAMPPARSHSVYVQTPGRGYHCRSLFLVPATSVVLKVTTEMQCRDCVLIGSRRVILFCWQQKSVSDHLTICKSLLSLFSPEDVFHWLLSCSKCIHTCTVHQRGMTLLM